MASYETIPAAAAEDGLLATPKPQPSLKRLVAGAAVLSFALGAVAATASTKIQTATSFKTNIDRNYIAQGCNDAFACKNISRMWAGARQRALAEPSTQITRSAAALAGVVPDGFRKPKRMAWLAIICCFIQ